MHHDWSRLEVEAAVADYLAMLHGELSGAPYNKAEHRRNLAGQLHGRSDGAIERKHQNISAALIALGFAYIPGYKPLRNFQQLLFDVVADRLANDAELTTLLSRQVETPVEVPTVDDILAAMVAPPTSGSGREPAALGRVRDLTLRHPGYDYLAREARNRSLGAAGEEFVVRFEQARLLVAGRDRLSGRVERVSETKGDGLGFDVLSFEATGTERWIEVKTTAYGMDTPFYVTRNEVAVSREARERYHLYRAFEFRKQPRLYSKKGALAEEFRLDPAVFAATVA